MDPNYNFDNSNETAVMEPTVNNTEGTVTNTPETRHVVIRESEIRAYRSAGWNRQRIAEKYGVDPQYIYRAMVDFGMLEARSPKNTEGYTVEFVRDCAFLG